MDVIFFSEMLKTLDVKEDTIRNAAIYCWANKSSADEIVKMVQRECSEAKRDKKIAFFYVLNDLLVNGAPTGDRSYIKAVGSKIKLMIADFVKGNENVNDMGNLVQLIDKWHNDQIFASSFTAKLRDLIKPAYSKLLEKTDQEKPQKQIMKYSKTFMVDYMTIQEFEPAKNLYEDSVTWTDISSKTNRFNNEYKKLDTTNPSAQVNDRIDELIRIGDEYKEQLIRMVQNLHVHYKVLSDRCYEEIRTSTSQNKTGRKPDHE